MTPQQLALATGARIDRAKLFLEPIERARFEFGIIEKHRLAAFLANVGHESGGLKFLTELWGPTDAQRRYEGRKDLGNVLPGDGFKYRGRGLFQTTGRDNYHRYGKLMGLELLAQPGLLALPDNAARSAGFYWAQNNLNDWADRLDFDGVCDIINRGKKTATVGDSNGWAERKALYAIGMEVLE